MASIKREIYHTNSGEPVYSGQITVTVNSRSSVTVGISFLAPDAYLAINLSSGYTGSDWLWHGFNGSDTYTFNNFKLNGAPSFKIWISSPSNWYFDGGDIYLDPPNNIPTVTLSPPTQLVVGNNTITVNASDSDGDSMTYSLSYRSRANSSSSWSGSTAIKTNDAISGTVNVSHNIPSSLMGYQVEYSVTVRDTYNGQTTKTASTTVKSNVAPTAPTAFVYPDKLRSETNYTISWSGASDADGNLSGYKVERTIDGGQTWTQIYQGAASSTTDRLDYGQAATVQYRVKSYDSIGAESGWYTAAVKAVTNNRAPSAPTHINVPILIYGGDNITITWGASSDADNNITAYVLERSVDGGTWTVVSSANKLTHVDTSSASWNTVQYRVKARDSEGDESSYTTSPTRGLESNKAPVITCAVTNLGVVTAPFTVPYSVSDPDGDTISVSEYVDSTLIRTYNATQGAAQTLSLNGMKFAKVLNGGHSVSVKATDAKGKSATHTVTFVKQVYEASVMLAPAQSLETKLGKQITKAVLTIVAELNDSTMEVLCSNNAKDTDPVWEDATMAVKNGINYVFVNTNVKDGNNFAFKVTLKRIPGGQGGSLSYIGGAFE